MSLTQSRGCTLAQPVQRYRLPLLAYFGRRVSSPAEAEDLAQDVFERLLKVLATEPILNAEALLFEIAVNLLRDRARRAHRHGIDPPLPSDSLPEFAEALTVDLSPERVVLGQTTLAEVLVALEELGERTRAMFCLYRVESLKVREIAALYGISPSGVEEHLSKALLHPDSAAASGMSIQNSKEAKEAGASLEEVWLLPSLTSESAERPYCARNIQPSGRQGSQLDEESISEE